MDRLEDYAPQTYPRIKRVQVLREINDILQKRADRTIPELLSEVKQTLGEEGADESSEIAQDVDDFLMQQRMLNIPYTKDSGREYKYRIFNPDSERALKIVNQQLFDRAAKAGFPPGFFRETFFDGVVFYCLPDYTTFRYSRFSNCTFAVCRVKNAMFDDTSIYSSTFHSCPIEHASFFNATLASTHFRDCGLQNVSFHDARMLSCNMFDCTMGNVNYLNATLDGGGFARVDAYDIRNLHTATITQGGATHEEINRLRIY